MNFKANNEKSKTFSNYEVTSEDPISSRDLVQTEVFTSPSKVSFYGMTLEDLKAFLKKHGKETYRAQQIFKWVYEYRVHDLEQMTNLSKAFRAELKDILSFDMPKIVMHLKSVDGTQKFLFDMGENNTVEAVLIPADDRLTLCISSEVGCNMGCKFCFTGKQKLKRRLTAAEIVGQFMQVTDAIQPLAESAIQPGADKSTEPAVSVAEGAVEAKRLRISNIVFMGMGEPLDNPDAVFKSIDILHSPWGMNLSRKKITVSTSGIVPEMGRIAESKVRLAVSLNGSNDEIRSKVMPINRRWPIAELMAACKDYYRKTGEHITFEYVLLKGVTDSLEDARRVVKLTRDIPCKINIIPFNEHPGSGFERSTDQQVFAFHQELMRLGAQVLLRRTMGRDIFAACGQLNSTYQNHPGRMDISNSKIGGTLVRDISSR